MKTFLLSFLTILILGAGIFIYTPAYATLDTLPGTSAENSFVPCGGGGEQPECTLDHLIGKDGIIQRSLNFSFVLVGFVGAILFMYAGFLMMTAAGNSGQITKAKGVFKNVTIGMIIILAAVLIVKQLLDYIDVDSVIKNIIK